jgi:hypothetical protein
MDNPPELTISTTWTMVAPWRVEAPPDKDATTSEVISGRPANDHEIPDMGLSVRRTSEEGSTPIPPPLMVWIVVERLPQPEVEHPPRAGYSLETHTSAAAVNSRIDEPLASIAALPGAVPPAVVLA